MSQIDFQNLDQAYINVDPLKQSYRKSVTAPSHLTDVLRKRHMALLCIDLQYLDAAPDCGVFAPDAGSDVPHEAQQYYFHTLKEIVFPNVRRLQDAFRKWDLEVIHIRIQSLTQDGRDRGSGHRALNLLAPPGSREAQFIEMVAPHGDEIIINKTASGVFTSTNLEYVLRNLKVDTLFVTGVYTNECVSTTVRDACDLGFFVTLVEDGCTTVTADLQDFCLQVLRDRYARIRNTDDVIQELETLHGEKNALMPENREVL